jgi:hypothetical protein
MSLSRAAVLGTTGHLLISLLLAGAAFIYGMAAEGGRAHDYEPTAHFSLSAFNVWNAGFTYIWRPIKAKILPDRRPIPFQKNAGEAALKAYRLQEKWNWIDRIRDWSDPIAFLSWAVLCGYGFACVRQASPACR